MTLSLRATNLPMKYERTRTAQRPGMTIWEVPGSGVFRVVETREGYFDVEAFMPLGWTPLIELVPGEAGTRIEAMQIWLDIQTPAPESNTQQEEEAYSHG